MKSCSYVRAFIAEAIGMTAFCSLGFLYYQMAISRWNIPYTIAFFFGLLVFLISLIPSPKYFIALNPAISMTRIISGSQGRWIGIAAVCGQVIGASVSLATLHYSGVGLPLIDSSISVWILAVIIEAVGSFLIAAIVIIGEKNQLVRSVVGLWLWVVITCAGLIFSLFGRSILNPAIAFSLLLISGTSSIFCHIAYVGGPFLGALLAHLVLKLCYVDKN